MDSMFNVVSRQCDLTSNDGTGGSEVRCFNGFVNQVKNGEERRNKKNEKPCCDRLRKLKLMKNVKNVKNENNKN